MTRQVETRTLFDRVGEAIADACDAIVITAIVMGVMAVIGAVLFLAFFGPQLLQQGMTP